MVVPLGLRSELVDSGEAKSGNADIDVGGVRGLKGDFVVIGLPGSLDLIDFALKMGLLLSLKLGE